jgi:hypothetical protein
MTTLRGFDNVFESTITNEISDNLVEFFDWGLLQKGNYFNIHKGEVDSSNFDISRLAPSENTAFPIGTAWEAKNNNWVWQSGINYDPPPINVSGVYVNDNFYSLNSSGNYAHYIDYHNGRVVFASGLPLNSKVQVEHSTKWINVDYADTNDRTVSSEEDEKIPPELLIKLPMIAIEVVSKPKMRGLQLGGGKYIDTLVLFNCLARDETTRDKIVDIVSYQGKSIVMFDSNKIAKSGEFPIDYRGFPIPGAMNYEQLVAKYPGHKIRFKDIESTKMEMNKSPLFGGVVKMVVELIKIDI